MALLKVSRDGMDSPQGPTGHFRSGEGGKKAGGEKHPKPKGKKGLVCSPMMKGRGRGIATRKMGGRRY